MSEQPPNQPPPPPGEPGQPYNPPPQQQPYQQPPQQPYQQPYQQPPQQPYQQPGGQFGGAPGYGAPGQLVDRFLARLIDGFILVIPIVIVYFVLTAIFLGGFSDSIVEWFLFGILYAVATVAIQLGYFAFFESSRGQTVGKMAMKLKTVGPDGASNPTMNQALRRNGFYALNLLAIIPILGTVLGNLAVLGAVIYIAVTINNDTANRQGFHDHFAEGTRVIKIG